jgi:hypothetical protein
VESRPGEGRARALQEAVRQGVGRGPLASHFVVVFFFFFFLGRQVSRRIRKRIVQRYLYSKSKRVVFGKRPFAGGPVTVQRVEIMPCSKEDDISLIKLA